MGGCDPEVEGIAGNEESCKSLEILLDVTLVGDASKPALWRARIRSAILPPGLRTGPSELSDSASVLYDGYEDTNTCTR